MCSSADGTAECLQVTADDRCRHERALQALAAGATPNHSGGSHMAKAGTLHDAFIDELRDTYDAERQLLKALPKLARSSTSPELRAAFESHLEETRGQVERLESLSR
jgi:hypothetical protein